MGSKKSKPKQDDPVEAAPAAEAPKEAEAAPAAAAPAAEAPAAAPATKAADPPDPPVAAPAAETAAAPAAEAVAAPAAEAAPTAEEAAAAPAAEAAPATKAAAAVDLSANMYPQVVEVLGMKMTSGGAGTSKVVVPAKLEEGIARRSSVAALKDQGILKPVDGSLAGAAAALEKARTEDALEKALGDQMRPGGPAQKVAENLEKGLAKRASAKELKDRGVLKGDGVAGSLASAATVLEEKMLKQALEKKLGEELRPGGPTQKVAESLEAALERRASAAELKDKGVLKPVDGSLAAAAVALEKAQASDALDKAIKKRESSAALLDRGVLKPEGVDGSIASTAAALEKARTHDKMNKKIASRASIADLEGKGVLKAEDAEETKEAQKEEVTEKLKTQLRRPSMVEADAAVAAAEEEKAAAATEGGDAAAAE